MFGRVCERGAGVNLKALKQARAWQCGYFGSGGAMTGDGRRRRMSKGLKQKKKKKDDETLENAWPKPIYSMSLTKLLK